MTDAAQSRPFNERAALEELERLAEKIQASRRQREAAEAQFETFVKAFRHDRYNQLITAHETERAALTPASSSPGVAATAVPDALLPAPRADAAPPFDPTEAWPPRASSRKPPLPLKPALAVAALIAVVLLALWLWPEGAPQAPAQSTSAAPAASTPPPAAGPAPVASTGPSKPLSFEMTTSREVWVRITADDRRLVERVLPANHRMTLDADRVILIRAGDGGAVRLSSAGRDLGVLGKDGFPANRTLTAPQPSGR